MKDIFDNAKLGDLDLKSRIIRTGIWETQTHDGGFLDQEVYDRYDKIAKSGVGAITSEIFALDHRDRFYPYSTHMNYKGFFKDYKELTDLTHQYNVPILGQLAFFWYNHDDKQKIEVNDLTHEDIRALQTDVIMAAKKFEFAGFDGIQLNLGNNFYFARSTNPYFNQRTDEYGGSLENRLRFAREIIKVIKKNYNLHINCRINPNDVRKGGITEDESIQMCKLLEEYGADSIQITSRTISSYSKDESNKHPFFIYSENLSDEVKLPIILGGTLRDMSLMNEILNSTNVEFFSMAKPFTAQKDFLIDWKKNGKGVSRCQNCNNCYTKKVSTCFKFEDD